MNYRIAQYDQIFGLPVMVSPLLPIVPTDGENARRIVRHGMKRLSPWLDIDPGPKPFETTEMLIVADSLLHKTVLYVSREMYYRIKMEAASRELYPPTESGAIEKVWMTREEWLRTGHNV